jgi:hypothetical protein
MASRTYLHKVASIEKKYFRGLEMLPNLK